MTIREIILKVRIDSRTANIFALFCCLLFVVTGSLWISLPGVQTDEALFGSGIYSAYTEPANQVRVFGHNYNLMVMTYVGAMKARLWSPILRTLGVSAATIRIPALLIGALGLWCFHRLLLRTLGARAAMIGTALLATDTTYLLTIRWDWGPVAIQHLMLIAGMLAVVRGRFGIAGFLFGLALWDKALFAWSLVGLGAAVLVVFPRRTLQSLSLRTAGALTIGLMLGALPLIIYNVRKDWVTFRSNAIREQQTPLINKVRLVWGTADSSVLFGSIARSDVPATGPTHNLQLYLLAGSLLLLPLCWRSPARSAVLFSLVFCVVVWVQMVPVQNGGTGLHHTILLWPMPAMIIAAVASAVSERVRYGAPLVVGLIALMMADNLLVTRSYYQELLRNGGVTAWSDAIYPVITAVRAMKPDQQLCVVEWGFWDNVRIFTKGRVRTAVIDDLAGEPQVKYARDQIRDPRNVFISHVAGHETQPGKTDEIIQLAAKDGYRIAKSQIFSDSNGRPTIRLFSFGR